MTFGLTFGNKCIEVFLKPQPCDGLSFNNYIVEIGVNGYRSDYGEVWVYKRKVPGGAKKGDWRGIVGLSRARVEATSRAEVIDAIRGVITSELNVTDHAKPRQHKLTPLAVQESK